MSYIIAMTEQEVFDELSEAKRLGWYSTLAGMRDEALRDIKSSSQRPEHPRQVVKLEHRRENLELIEQMMAKYPEA
jgi:hypothetical protein